MNRTDAVPPPGSFQSSGDKRMIITVGSVGEDWATTCATSLSRGSTEVEGSVSKLPEQSDSNFMFV